MSIYSTSLDIDDYMILQDTDDYAFSQDSVFLANSAKIGRGDRVLDLGCGTGILATLALVKKHAASAVGIELQPSVAELARESAKLNRLDDRLQILTGDVKDIKTLVTAESFDIVLCNPPYFEGNQVTKKNLSRIESSASLFDFAYAASYALRFGGDAWFVSKIDRLSPLMCALVKTRLEPKEMTIVYPKLSTGADIVIIKARKGGKVGLQTHTVIVMDEDGNYTKTYKDMYK